MIWPATGVGGENVTFDQMIHSESDVPQHEDHVAGCDEQRIDKVEKRTKEEILFILDRTL